MGPIRLDRLSGSYLDPMPACLHVHKMSAMEAQQTFVRLSILVIHCHNHREVIIILLQKSITDNVILFLYLCR